MIHNPPHPGEFIKTICLEPLGLSITQAVIELGVSRKTLPELLNGHTGISPELSLRLAKAFNTTPESWLTQQMYYDLLQAKQKVKNVKVKPLWKKKAIMLNLAIV